MTTVTWRAFLPEDPWAPITDGPQNFDVRRNLRQSYDVHDAIQEACQSFFAKGNWSEWFGDDDEAVIMVEIVEPAFAAGFYEVALNLEIEAHLVRAIPDPRVKP